MPRDFQKELEVETSVQTSVDMQIDKYLIEAEKHATTSADLEETNHSNLKHNAFKQLIKELFLIEQEEGEEKPKEEDEEETEEDIEAMLGLEDETPSAPTGGGGEDFDFSDEPSPDDEKEEKAEEQPEEEPEELEVEKKPMINIDGFCSKVARLVKNYDDLLSIRDAIVNRAVAYISENYGEDAAFVARQSLQMNFDM